MWNIRKQEVKKLRTKVVAIVISKCGVRIIKNRLAQSEPYFLSF